MKELFYRGGPHFMSILTILLIITTAWIMYHFVVAYRSKQTDKTVFLRKLGYGKSMGLFALITGVMGQIIGFSALFSTLKEIKAIGGMLIPERIFGGIQVTMIVTIYGCLIYLLSLLLWFIATMLVEKKQADHLSA